MYTAETLKEHLDKLIAEETYIKIYLEYMPPDTIEKLLSSVDGVDLKKWHDFETNGWDLDFWFYFEYKDTKLTFSGSWYYGQYTITKD